MTYLDPDHTYHVGALCFVLVNYNTSGGSRSRWAVERPSHTSGRRGSI